MTDVCQAIKDQLARPRCVYLLAYRGAWLIDRHDMALVAVDDVTLAPIGVRLIGHDFDIARDMAKHLGCNSLRVSTSTGVLEFQF